jgi:hypothetical protein
MRILAGFMAVWTLLTVSGVFAAANDSKPSVDVFLWFDTEDYILPEADDALLRIATFLESEGVSATFKIVGEKARVLEKRGRTDILRVLASHDVGYHTNFHSAHPTPAEFLSDLGWFEGVREFERREEAGVRDVRRITGRMPSCYGQPGSSWAPQVYGALQDWGIGVYLDDTRHIDVSGRPYYYGGVLNLLSLKHTLRTELGGDSDLAAGKEAFEEAYREIEKEGGGVVSIYYHPCEFVHAQFWDGVNFSNGANPGRDQWKVPPMKSREQIETGFRTFEAFIRYIKTFPGVHFRRSRAATALYPDVAYERSWSPDELRKLARRVSQNDVNFFEAPSYTLSAAEIFRLLVAFGNDAAHGQVAKSYSLGPQTIMGPVRPAEQPRVEASGDQFLRTLADVEAFTESNSRVPDDIWLGSVAVSPESFLRTLAAKIPSLAGIKGETVAFEPARLAAADNVRTDDSLWDWVIFPTDFTAPEMMELAKRQAWTLKPALRLGSR